MYYQLWLYFSLISTNKRITSGGLRESLHFHNLSSVLGILIRQNKNIKGIKIGEYEIKSGQFVDGMTLFFLFDKDSLEAAADTLKKVLLQYWTRNQNWIGSIKNTEVKLPLMFDITWTNEPLNNLGAKIDHDNIIELNYAAIVTKINNITEAWCN